MNRPPFEKTAGGAVVATGAGIEIFTWLALRGALRLESVGLKRRGPSARALACQRLGLPSRTKIPALLLAVAAKVRELETAAGLPHGGEA